MNTTPCSALDDYLANDLAGAARARFADHLAGCADCRRAVREQQRLDALLTEATARLEPVPAELAERVGRRLKVARRRRLAAAVAALTAAAVVAWLLARPAPLPVEPEPPVAKGQPEPPAPEAPPPEAVVRVKFPAGADVLAVRARSESPNVTFIWVYTGRRAPRPEPAAPETTPPPEKERSDL